jgi:hypothetical protein
MALLFALENCVIVDVFGVRRKLLQVPLGGAGRIDAF